MDKNSLPAGFLVKIHIYMNIKKPALSADREIGWLLQEKYPEINPSDLSGASNGKRVVAAKKDIERLKAGEPLDHIIGFVEFLGCKILVDNNVLIPRAETEFWTEKTIEDIYSKLQRFAKEGIAVLDMFAGSGAIGVAIMRHVKNARMTFADSEKGSIRQIKKNLKANSYKLKPKVIQSDIFEKVTGKFDVIVANPPYIPNNQETRNKIQTSVIDYEPHVALFGGEDGLDLIRRFLAEAKNRLNTGGKIYMEFDSPQKPAITALLKKLKYRTWDFHKDQYGKVRYVVVQ